MIKKQTEKEIVKFLKGKIQDISGVYVFGSYISGLQTPNSDLDIAFLNDKKIPAVEKWSIQEELASILNTDIDLIDLKDATVILRVEVVENGIRIFSGNSYKCDIFETITYSLFSDLNESRIDIINDLKENYG